MKYPIRYLEYQGTLITNECPPPSAIWIGVVDWLSALYVKFCQMAVPWTQIIVFGGKFLRALHYITVVSGTPSTSDARKLVGIRPLGSPLRPWVMSIHVSSLGRSLILDERISLRYSMSCEVTTYVGRRFFGSQI